MGDLFTSEAFQECCFITVTATGLGAPGLAPTCIAIRISNNTRTPLTVQEVGSGWYRVTDLAAAIGNAEAYGTEWAVAGANTIHGPFKVYKVGGGQLQAIFDRLGAPAGASLAADLLAIDNFVDGIEADIGAFPTVNYATLAAYVEDVRTRLIAIVGDTNEIQVSLADGGFTDLLIDAIKAKTDNLPVDPADASDIAAAHALLATEAKQDIIDGIVDDIKALLVDGGVIDQLIDDIKAKTDNLPVDPADASDIAAAHALLATEAKQDIIDTNVDDIEADTNEIQISLADGGFTDLLIDAIKAKTDNLPVDPADASDIATAHALLATEAKQDIIDTNVDDVLADTAAMQPSVARIINSMTFWSEPTPLVTITAGAQNLNLASCVVAGLPAGVTLVRVIAYLIIDGIQDTSGADNAINNADCDLAVDADVAYGSTVDAITIPDNSFVVDVSEATVIGGSPLPGTVDVKAEVTGNATYYARLENAQADGANLLLRGVKWGLKVYFSL